MKFCLEASDQFHGAPTRFPRQLSFRNVTQTLVSRPQANSVERRHGQGLAWACSSNNNKSGNLYSLSQRIAARYSGYFVYINAGPCLEFGCQRHRTCRQRCGGRWQRRRRQQDVCSDERVGALVCRCLNTEFRIAKSSIAHA